MRWILVLLGLSLTGCGIHQALTTPGLPSRAETEEFKAAHRRADEQARQDRASKNRELSNHPTDRVR